MGKLLKPIFWLLIGAFLFVAGEFFIPAIRETFQGSVLFLLPFFIFFLLGVILLFLSLKEKTKAKLRIFLILTSASAAGFFIGVILHNLFYALAIISAPIIVLSYSMQIFDVFFFLVSTFLCPIGFLIGAVMSVVLFIKKKMI